MAATKRNDLQIVKDRVRISELYLSGKSQAHIASELGLTQQMVSYDLSELRRSWTDRAVNALEAARAEELAKIDNLEREYWDAWQSSKKEGVETSVENTTGDKAITKAGQRKKGRDGNPAFLQGVQWCIDRRCKLQGLDEIRETDMTIRWDMMSDDELAARAKSLGLVTPLLLGEGTSGVDRPTADQGRNGQAGPGPWITEEG
jgi:predicted transcriptional regulator